ncbi:MAG: CARDB domain-containing protein [Promethearchaeota archaeon]
MLIALFMLLPMMVPSSEGVKSLEDGKTLFSELDIDTIRLSAGNGAEAKETVLVSFSIDSIEDKAFSISLLTSFSGEDPDSDFNIEVNCNNRFFKSKSISSTTLEKVDKYWVNIIVPFDNLLEGNNLIEIELAFVSSNDGTTTFILHKESYVFLKTISHIQTTGEYSFDELGGALPYPAEFQDYLESSTPEYQTVKASLEFSLSEEVMTDKFSTDLRAFYSVENYPNVYNISLSLFWNQEKLSTTERGVNNKSQLMEISTNVNKSMIYEGRNSLDIEFSIFGNESQYAIDVLSNSTIQVSAFRDVAVNRLSITPQVIEPGDIVTIKANIKNQGSKDEFTTVHLKIDNKLITTTQIKLLEGQSIQKQFHWEAKKGSHQIIVFVEIKGLSMTKEVNSQNNNLTQTLYIPTRDVTLSHVEILPKHPPASGETIKVAANLENTGKVNETVNIKLYIDNTLVNATKVNVLVGSSVEVTLEWDAIEGQHTILVMISGIENEANIRDNSYSTTILVLDPLFSISLYGKTFQFDIIDIQFLYGAILVLLTHILYFSFYLRRLSFVEKHYRDILIVTIGLTFPLLLSQAYAIRRTFGIPLLFEGLIIGNILLCNILFFVGRQKWTTGSILGKRTTTEIIEYFKRKFGISEE